MPRGHLLGVLVAVVAVWAHQLLLAGWVVDDAAISFAYARNLAAGEGLVVVPGGERVEGYSNPLWVGMLAVAELLGVQARLAAKALALALSAWSTWAVCQVAWKERSGGLALLASVFFALSAQTAIWNASGLENALFTAAVLAGVLALQSGWLVWAGLAFGAVALTRPEGIAYGMVAGAWVLRLKGRPGWRFWLPLLAPFLVYEAFRIAYFAWPFPNTYYAKVGFTGGHRLQWTARGWRQLRQWGLGSGVVWLLPIWIAALSRNLRWAILAMLAVGLGVFAPWEQARVAAWIALGVLLPMGAPGRRGVLGHLVTAGLAFSIYADGDWMRGHRWMSLVMGPLAVLFALGVREWVDAARNVLGDSEPMGLTAWASSAFLVGPLVPLHLEATQTFAKQPVDYPEMIARRLAYTDSIADTLGLDSRFVSTLEMDMGAHMLDGDYTLVDLAGLVDVPISRRGLGDREFFAPYVFEERKPTFAHVHKHWAKISGIRGYEEWNRDYVELPPYQDGSYKHGGVHVRRDLLFQPTWEGPVPEGLPVEDLGLTLEGVEIATPIAGDQAVVRFGVSGWGRPEPVVLLIDGPSTSRWRVPWLYGWLSDGKRRGQVWHARASIDTRDFEPGEYTLSISLGSFGTEVGSFVVDGSGPHPIAPCSEADAQRRRDRGFAVTQAEREALSACLAARGTVEDLERARLWDHRNPEFLKHANAYADARYAVGLAARAAEDDAAAFQAFSEVVRVTPWNAWARRYAEEARP